MNRELLSIERSNEWYNRRQYSRIAAVFTVVLAMIWWAKFGV
jgi:hypothetical protein